ncbi:hypothetical protein [Streptomyces sp. NBC_00893]|nr:hypothetical protein [Streptomyces sp. NBC_00893]MCX4851330.1 hypothetical protein [Streptomyces sp. NBC_00893]
MVSSCQDVAFEEGLVVVAKEYASVHGRFFPPTTADWDGHPGGASE